MKTQCKRMVVGLDKFDAEDCHPKRYSAKDLAWPSRPDASRNTTQHDSFRFLDRLLLPQRIARRDSVTAFNQRSHGHASGQRGPRSGGGPIRAR